MNAFDIYHTDLDNISYKYLLYMLKDKFTIKSLPRWRERQCKNALAKGD